MTQTKSVIRAVAKYDKSNIKGLYIKLHKEKDADIIQKLDNVNSKQGYVKRLIREDIQMEMNNINEIPLKDIYLLLLKDLRSKQDKDSSYYMALSYAIEAIEFELYDKSALDKAIKALESNKES